MKHIFENKIKDCDKAIINATEGGLNIAGAQNMLLKDVIARYVNTKHDIDGMMADKNFKPVANSKIQWAVNELAHDFAMIKEDCEEVCDYLNAAKEVREAYEPEKAINRLRAKQDAINLLEDISTETTLYMTRQDVIDCDKIESQEARIKEQKERALKYYKTIGDNAGFMEESFGEIIK